MSRKPLFIVAIVVVLAGIGVAAYFYFANKNPGITTTPGITLPGSDSVVPASDTDSSNTTPTPVGGSAGSPARLVQISKGPVVLGEVVVDIETSSTTPPDVSVSYIERQSGNVFHYLTKAGTITRTSNHTIPGIQSATWLPDGSMAFVRYLSGSDFSIVNTYALPADGASGFFLSQNISGIAVSTSSVLTLAAGVNGTAASLANSDGTHSSALFSTALSSLRASFAGKSAYLAFTKPSASLSGYAFLVDSKGHFTRIAGPASGLVALASPQGKWVVVSYMRNRTMQMDLINTVTNETLSLPVATIVDKCVWAVDDSSLYCATPTSVSPSAEYPDDWYQGATQFADRLWKIDVSGRFAQLVLDFSKETNTTLDADALAIDPANSTLVFVNRVDRSLWSYQL